MPSHSTRVSTGTAILRRPIWFLLLVAIFVGLGILASASKKPQYQAETHLIVGNSNSANATAPGTVQSNIDLASNYARLLNTPSVRNAITKKATKQSAGTVSASPIAESSIIVVTATSPNQNGVTNLAKIAGDALVKYVDQINRNGANAGDLLAQYTQAASNVSAATRDLDAANRRGVPADIDTAKSHLDTVTLEAQALQQQYLDRVKANENNSSISVVAPATPAGDNKRSTLQKYVVLGLLAGGMAGAALVTWRENRESEGWRARRRKKTISIPENSEPEREPDLVL